MGDLSYKYLSVFVFLSLFLLRKISHIPKYLPVQQEAPKSDLNWERNIINTKFTDLAAVKKNIFYLEAFILD